MLPPAGNAPPAGWTLIGQWGAGGGANGSWAGPDGPWGSSLMVPKSSCLNSTFTNWGGFGPNIFYGGGTPKTPLVGRYAY